MFTGTIILCLVVLALLVLSIRERIRLKNIRERAWDGSETKSSPLSEALTNLIGTAGGIYISLVMLFSFMELQIPNSVQVMNTNLEPLAAVSFGLAIIQPFVVRLFQLRRKF